MRRVLLLGAIFLGLSGIAQARTSQAGRALLGMSAMAADAQASCPAGAPVQALTIVNQAKVSPFALAKVERAIVDQSVQLRAAWGTPCVQFAAGGWPVYLRIGGTEWGVHYGDPTRAVIYTGGLPMVAWSTPFSHEIVEMLVDRGAQIGVMHAGGNWGTLEVADPVEHRAYRLDGVWVSDFALPAWFAGGEIGTCATVWTPAGDTTQCGGPLVAPDDAGGPYDEMGIIPKPWDLTWGTNEDSPTGD